MNIAIYKTTKDEHFFLDYRGTWRPIDGLLKECKPRTFVGGIPHCCRTPEPGTVWAEPYPEMPNLKRLGLVTD